MKREENKYILSMFPYPSGAGLHVGHAVGYLATDIYSRHLKRKGFNVFHPFGFDSFGLPTEQYALKTGKDPKVVTEENIKRFKEQLNLLSLELNWESQIITSDEKYYKWTQWIFMLLYNSWYNTETNKAENIETCKHKNLSDYRLAYKKMSKVNWCEELGTVLANDEIEDGKSIRGGYPITEKEMEQWFLRITPYADRLIQDLEHVDWRNKQHQINFIGRSEGFEIDFQIENFPEKITVFTTKPETLRDVEFIVTSKNSHMAIKGKEGEYFTGYHAVIPIYNKSVPIWVADYVLDGYGTGFVMGVPSDDKRDREFAERHHIPFNEIKKLYNDTFIKDNLTKNNLGRLKINYKLHDITFSRQRKWGEPIPIEGETDTMPSSAGSNWYFFRYLDAHNENFFCDLEKQKQWLPVDLYVGGAEHTTGHVLYARFITKVLYDLGYSSTLEPFKKIINVGLMNGSDGRKMSKSTGNSVTPDEMIQKWGVDAFRLWISFIAPFEQSKVWKEDGLKGCAKFLRSFERLFESTQDVSIEKQEELVKSLSEKISKDIERFSFNTAVPHFMKFVNEMSREKVKSTDVVFKALDVIEPFTPNFVKDIKQRYK